MTRLVLDVPDYPLPGVMFKDITPLLADPSGLASVVVALAEHGRGPDGTVVIDKVVGMEARGFILGAPVALALGAGFVPVRKAGKLPRATHAVSYSLEYGEATLEVHQDAVAPGERVLLIDDVLATGGTIAATRRLIEACEGTCIGVAVLMELTALGGRAALGDLPIHAVMTV
ncbi:adenine phosphoribosyltransferase [Nocardioides sp.]|uniref:adenine phosphoribosyltransferase n=1 Tax=Nocardioides sp. TaxID=35761 RepID=UPI002BD13479|nr:adenine phosphoribosyltransferase [Nocardioides sp.]HXH78474.1 adenine phosphoribosyltransferase [Nocardioides sp.]